MKKTAILPIIGLLCLLITLVIPGCLPELKSFSVQVEETGGDTFVSENGETDTYSLVLGKLPSADVVVNITPDNQLSVSQSQVTFTSSNWNVEQTITVSAIDDRDTEGDHTGQITHTATSTDDNYNGIEIESVVVAIEDNDLSRIISGSRTGRFVVVDPVTGVDIAESTPNVKHIGETSLGYMSQKAILVSPVVQAGNPVIYTCDPLTGGNLNQLFSDSDFYVMNIDGSPVEPRIVFSAKAQADFKLHIYTINEDGTNLARLSQHEELLDCFGISCKIVGADRPSWSPDGSRVACVVYLREVVTNYSHNAVIVMSADGGNKTTVFNIPNKAEAHYDDVCWTRDGEFLIFGVSEGGISKIKALHISTKNAQDIQQHMEVGGTEHESHWISPLQNKILFTLHSPGGSNLYTVDYSISGSSLNIISAPNQLTDQSNVGHGYQEADWELWDGL